MKWHILLVDDDPDIGRQAKALLDGPIGRAGDEIITDYIGNFGAALQKLDTMLYDLVILDVFRGEPTEENPATPGEKILHEIKKRCFVPVIFYTALPSKVNQYKSSLVRIVHKTTGGIPKLRSEIMALIRTGLPAINRKLVGHLSKVEAKYMWEFVEPSWRKFSTVVDSKSLAYLLSRRLAWSLTRENIPFLIDSLGGTAGTGAVVDLVHPVEYYIYPPTGTQYNSGDILSRRKKKKVTYRIILTPSCDMFKRDAGRVKSERVLVAGCISLSGTEEVKKWRQNDSVTAKDCLRELMKNNKKGGQKERYHFLPGTFFLPNLIVDFQILDTIPFKALKQYKKVATLDSPFAECVLNRFCRYIGRIGTPDINLSEIDNIIDNLKRRMRRK